MKFGIIVTTGDPRTIAERAAEAEAAGSDGVFYWDGVAIGPGEIYDPWVVMAAIVAQTADRGCPTETDAGALTGMGATTSVLARA